MNPNLLPAFYDCVRFNPTDVEVFQRYLTPFIEGALDIPRSLMFISNMYETSPDVFNTQDLAESDYFQRGHVWLLVTRHPKNQGSLEANRTVGDFGVWSRIGRKGVPVLEGQDNMGVKQRFRFTYTRPAAIARRPTGWEMTEFIPSSPTGLPPQFKDRVACHLVYTADEDNVRISGNGHLIPDNNGGAGGAGNNNGGGGAGT